MTLHDPNPPPDEPLDLARRLAAAINQYPAEANAARLILESNGARYDQQEERPRSRTVDDPEGRELPHPCLRAIGQTGMIMPQGGVAILAAEGGIGKSSLVGIMALGIAAAPPSLRPEHTTPLMGNAFEGRGGKVLIATYEDGEGVTRWRIHELARKLAQDSGSNQPLEACSKISVIGMNGWPLYGPTEGAAYASRPVTLQGWSVMWEEAAVLKPSLIIVDPAMDAYVGEPSSVSSVREFYKILHQGLARFAPEAGMLITAHSTKAARSSGGNSNPFDPGLVAGSAAWTDRPRGVMTMTWNEDNEDRTLAIVKSNLGPQRITLKMTPVHHDEGTLLGMEGKGEWNRPGGRPLNTNRRYEEEKYDNIGA